MMFRVKAATPPLRDPQLSQMSRLLEIRLPALTSAVEHADRKAIHARPCLAAVEILDAVSLSTASLAWPLLWRTR